MRLERHIVKMDGLIIKKEWLDLIVEGKKTIEVRGNSTGKTDEHIYLLESGSHLIRATCRIEGCYPISCSDWSEERENHCINIPYADIKKRYKNPTAWIRAVIWVKNVVPVDGIQEQRRRMRTLR